MARARFFLALAAAMALASVASPAAQVRFEQAIQDLSSADASVRLKSVRLLKDAAYPESAVPIARLIVDPVDDVQLEAIAAELNIFSAEKVIASRRVAGVVELRSPIAADAVFTAGPLALSGRPAPADVLSALRVAARDDNPRVYLEALYAWGALAADTSGETRQALIRSSGADVAAMLGSAWPLMRVAAARVMGRAFAWRPGDGPLEVTVGDALITALNDRENDVRLAAMEALGAIRYDRGVTALTALMEYYRRGRMAEAAFDALAHIAHPASKALFGVHLMSKNDPFKLAAIEALARGGDPSTAPTIDGSIRHDRNEAILLAGSFAGSMLTATPIDPIVGSLRRSKLHDQAAAYLVELAASGHSSEFSRHLQDPDEQIRLDLVNALGLGRDPGSLAMLDPLQHDKDPHVAAAASRAVARLRAAAR